jgi:HEAT repeat protein
MKALEARKERIAFEPLRESLMRGSSRERLAAVKALSRIDATAAEPLVAFFVDRTVPDLHAQASETRIAACDALAQLKHARAVDQLLPLLSDDDPSVRSAAEDALVAIGRPAASALFPLMQDRHRLASEAAARTLERMKTDIPAGEMIAVMRDGDRTVRRWALDMVSDSGYQDAGQVLALLLREEHPGLRAAAVRITTKMRTGEARDPLIAALGDESPVVRSTAAELLGTLRDPAAVPPLLTALNDGSDAVRRNASRALEIYAYPDAKETFHAALQEGNLLQRRSGVRWLRNSRDPRAVPYLIEALRDRDDGVRREAVKGLGAFKDIRAVEPLIACLDDEAFIIKREAAEALTKITGRNIGLVSDKWRAWWAQNRAQVDPQVGQ